MERHKVLKSFNSAHEAVNWMIQNRVKGTSIETTGTLKSMGMGQTPSGNYHVVLSEGKIANIGEEETSLSIKSLTEIITKAVKDAIKKTDSQGGSDNKEYYDIDERTDDDIAEEEGLGRSTDNVGVGPGRGDAPDRQ